MQRGDKAVIAVSVGLAAIVVATITFSIVVLDRTPSSATVVTEDDNSSRLVVTWGPSLCTVDPANSGCRSGHVEQMGQTFVLHGLWPQPFSNQYCDVPKDVVDRAGDIKGNDMPPLELPDDVRNTVQANLSDASVMAPHEWYAHGTCSGVAPAKYFGDATTLADQARALLDPMFTQASKKKLTINTVRDGFNAAFGQGAGDRVAMSCRNVTGEGAVVYELQLSLPPVIELGADGNPPSLKEALLKGPPINSVCRSGRVP